MGLPVTVDSDSDSINNGNNTGSYCWTVAGTYCNDIKQGTFAKKLKSCMSCEFYQLVQNEEGRRFIIVKNKKPK